VAAQTAEYLAGFGGTLQVDGYGAYAELAEAGSSRSVGRMCADSSTRSRSTRRRRSRPRRSHASPHSTPSKADIRGRSADERKQARQQRSKPLRLVDSLRVWLEAKLAVVSGKSKVAEAIRYALSRWEGRARFLDDGRIEIDSNVVEPRNTPDRNDR
jgi:transposase